MRRPCGIEEIRHRQKGAQAVGRQNQLNPEQRTARGQRAAKGDTKEAGAVRTPTDPFSFGRIDQAFID
jgi:hypothetical protein